MKYFVFNKASDYTRGYKEHVTSGPEGLFTENGYYGRAAFFSRILDSAEQGTIWHRMTCCQLAKGSVAARISFYTSEELVFEDGGRTVDIRELIRSRSESISRKKELLFPFLKKQLPFETDILLHSLEGRYFWFLLEIYPQADEPVGFGQFMVYFPAQSWMGNLPEIYRQGAENDSFLDRYLSIFQSLHDDVERKIRGLADCFDPGTADREFLEWMASWLDVEEPYIWTQHQLRYLLEHAREFYDARGTRRGIELFVKLYTGEAPFVIEWQDWEGHRTQKGQGSLLEHLYEDDPERFTVLVREECIPEYKDYQTLLRIIEQVKPVQMELHLVVLKPYIFADGYSYLGVNSVLGQYEGAVLGGTSRLAFAAIPKEERNTI